MPKNRKSYWSVSEIGPSPLKVDADAADADTDDDDDGRVSIWKAPLPGGTAELKSRSRYVKVIHLRTHSRLWWAQIVWKSVNEIWSYRANKILHCDLSKVTHLRTHPRLWWDASLGQIVCKSVKEIWSYHSNEILHCDLGKTWKSRSKVGQDHSSSNSSKAMVVCITQGQLLCKLVNEIWSYHANKLCGGQHFYVPPMASPWRGTKTWQTAVFKILLYSRYCFIDMHFVVA